MTETTPESPEQPEPAAAPAAPAPAPMPVTIVRTPVRERLHGTGPTLVVFALGALFGTVLTLGVAEVADDDHREGVRIERMGPDGPGFHMPGGPGR